MGAAWLDLARGGDVAAVLADLRTGAPSDEPTELTAWTAGSRIELCSDGVGYGSLGDLVAGVLGRTAAVARAVVLLDHDEYGSEHIVLTCDGVGTVRRVHHVYVDPEGEPSLTDVPPMPGVGPGRGRGALLDDAAARAMLGDLFGVPAKTMPKRAEQAHDWLDALGVAWVGAAGGAPVNLRPGPVWRDTVAQDVVPRLPGRWLPRDYDLVRLPASLTPVLT
jgi:hypothetical protein